MQQATAQMALSHHTTGLQAPGIAQAIVTKRVALRHCYKGWWQTLQIGGGQR
jgi:hypothetical protein